MKKCNLLIILTLILNIGICQVPYLVKNIHPSFGTSSYPDNLTNVNGTLFFSANDGSHGYELWKSNGTTAGTVMVKDLVPGGTGNPSIRGFINVNGTLFFETKVGKELWKSDGTTVGTDTVITFPTIGSLIKESFISFNNSLFFVVANGSTHELWKSGGTTATTTMIKSFTPSSGLGIDYESIIIFNNELYFTANNGTIGKEIWKSNGTTSGTVPLKDINPGSSDGVPWASYGFFTEVNNELFFIGDNGTNGEELWKTDGTTIGTIIVKDIRIGASGSGINKQTKVGDKLYFTVFISGNNSLWISDGTSSGTVKLTDISYIDNLMELDSATLIFTHKTTALGNELWISNGTTLGTKLLKDINPGSSNGIYSNYALFLNINGTLFFKGDDPIHGEELWKTDGTDTGTLLVKDITPGSGRGFNNNSEHFFEANGLLFFDGVSQYGGTNTELWQSDGTDTGTIRHNIDTNGGGSHPRKFTLIDTTLFFTANDKFKGIELYAIHVDTIVTTSGGSGGGGSTSIFEKQKQINITLFPNPTSGKIRVKGVKNYNSLIYIMDINGKILKKELLQNEIINLENLSKGMYFISFDQGGKRIVKKVILE